MAWICIGSMSGSYSLLARGKLEGSPDFFLRSLFLSRLFGGGSSLRVISGRVEASARYPPKAAIRG